MPKKIDYNEIINCRFELLTVKKYLGNRIYLCKCDCGNEKKIRRHHIISGNTKSCGCKYNKHNKSKTSEHGIWRKMKDRCINSNGPSYKDYGGRGIKVCDSWLDKEKGFINFIEDMVPRPSKKYSVERNNVNGNYEPSNCRWATAKEQSRNRRDSIKLTYKGETKSLQEWSEIFNIQYRTLLNRIEYKWDIEIALTRNVSRKQKHYINL